MTTTINQIVKEVLDQMEGQTFSEYKQFRDILEGKLTSRLNHLISGLKEEMPSLGKSSGEWCLCGAWKQYGVADTHHCSGPRITC